MVFLAIVMLINVASLGIPVFLWHEIEERDASLRRPVRMRQWILLVTTGCLLWIGSVVCVSMWHGLIWVLPIFALNMVVTEPPWSAPSSLD
jgi:O-antigen/teichoic acid export membrane protein